MYKNVLVGNNPPLDINTVIEIPMNSSPVKYEIDSNDGLVWVDRINATPMFYPINYGFVPNTLAGDGDPVDVMVVSRYDFIVGSIVNVRPIGVLLMEDDGGMDDKILAVPTSSISPYYDNIHQYSDLPAIFLQEIEHFFVHYKDLNKNKWSKVSEWKDSSYAQNLISNSIKKFAEQ